MAGAAAEAVLAIAALVLLLPLALIALAGLWKLDPEDVDIAENTPHEAARSWRRRAGAAILWIAPGLLFPAALGMYFSRPEVWAVLALYVSCNLIGTITVLGEFDSRPRATWTLKALFVLQAPAGVLFLLADGL